MDLSPDWVEAVGTWVGGIGTVGTLIYAGRALRHETERRRQDVDDLRKAERSAQDAQARTVVLHDAGVDGHLFGRMDQYKIVVGNYGMHPITNVVGKLVYRETQAQLGKFIGGPAPLPVLEGGKRQQLQWEVMIKWPGAAQQHELPDHFDLEVQFTDVNGIRWAVRPGLGQQPSRVYDIE